jgi:hypothetical protein
MRNSRFKIFLFILIASFITGCSVFNKAGSKKYTLVLTNPLSIERADELVVLTREMIEQKTGKLHDKFISITSPGNKPVVVQFDDLNKDGRWDEAAFLYKFEPDQKVELTVAAASTKINDATIRAHVRMRQKNADNKFGPLLDSVTVPRNTPPTDFTKQKLPPYLTEGPAWENDKVAFRIYMDTRNTKDIFGKRTTAMMMDTVGVNPENVYHHLADWGMDILAVGKSLGAGSLALSVPVNGKDTLVRLGGANVEQTSYEKIADGPIRGILRMHYKNWVVANGFPPVNVTEEIRIWGGKYFYESSVTVENAPAGSKLVTGIVNLKSKKSEELNTNDCRVVYTYDVQSENKDKLGLAIAVKNEQFTSFGKTPNEKSDVLNTYTVSLPVNRQPATFRFYAGWEMSDLLFVREESFRKFLNYEASKYSKAIGVTWR